MAEPVNVVVGAGQAGAHAAMAMRDAGFDGRIVLLGEEPHAPYERPPLSKAALTETPAPAPAWVFGPERYGERGIDLRLGARVTRLDPASRTVTLADGEPVAFDKLLLATGGAPRRLSLPGHERVQYVRTLADAQAIRARLAPGAQVVCIGAGVIGLEVAASARKLGCAVTVLEAAGGALGRGMTPDMARWMVRLHERHGVALQFGVQLVAITADAVVLADGTRHAADVVVAGIGIVRNTALAQAAGLEVDHGIVVDEFGRTGLEGIFAAGDVAAFWHPVLGRRLRLESWNTRRTTASPSAGRWPACRRNTTTCRGTGPTSSTPPCKSAVWRRTRWTACCAARRRRRVSRSGISTAPGGWWRSPG